MPKRNPFKITKGIPKHVYSPPFPSDSQPPTVNGRTHAQSDSDTGNSESGSSNENLILSRLRQQGIIAPALPSAKTASTSSGSRKQNAVFPDSGVIPFPSSSKLERFQQQVARP